MSGYQPKSCFTAMVACLISPRLVNDDTDQNYRRGLKPIHGVIKLFSCSTRLSTKFILLINVKMSTIVGILTFISMINTTSERLKARNFFICRYFSFYEQFKFRVQLS